MADGFYYGVYRGQVVANNDPTGRGRIQVLVPSVTGQTSGWAEQCGDYEGMTIPNVGAIAWIAFEGGDPSKPVWMGCIPDL